MHALHAVLVNLTDKKLSGYDKEDDGGVKRIRDYAEKATECFSDSVFDWRETDTAGRWEELYEENVLIGEKDKESIIEVLEKKKEYQESELKHNFSRIYENTGTTDLKEISGMLINSVVEWNLKVAVDIIVGEYTIESEFYDTWNRTAKVTDETIKMVSERPNKWAVVLFDYHI